VRNLGSKNSIPFEFVCLCLFLAIFSLSSTAFAGGGQLMLNPSTINFSAVSVGTSQTQAVTVTNPGGSKMTVTQATVSGTGFTLSGPNYPVTLSGGQSATCYVTFNPQSTSSVSGNLSVWYSTQSNGKGHGGQISTTSTVTLPVSGTGVGTGLLTTNPTSLIFGNIQMGNSQTLTETLTNSGAASLTISAVSTTSSFVVSGLSLPIKLSASQSVSFSVIFSPTSSGTVAGSMTITSNASNPTVNVPLSGTGVSQGTLGANPTSLSFGGVTVGNNKSLSETVTNTGGSSVTISQVSASGTGFSLSGITAPLTLTAGQSATFTVTFTAASATGASGNVSIISNASNATLNIPLSGTGVSQGSLGSNPTSLSFGSVAVGNNNSLSETVTNTGGSSVTISQTSISGSGFSISGITTPVTLTAGQSATFTVTFTPASATGASGSVSIISNASNTALSIPLSGTGVAPGQLAASPASVNFASVPVGSTVSLVQTLTNSGGSALTISQITPSGAGFGMSGIVLPLSLAAGQSTTFSATFAPQSGGSFAGNLTITSTGSNSPLSVPLSGTGSLPGQLTITPVSLNFGSVMVGTTQSQTGVLSAGSSAITVSSVGVSGSQFSVGGISLPVTIAAGSSVSFQVAFAPQTAGAASSNVTFVSNAANSPTVQSLSGTATAPQHSVTLSWNTSTSSDVAGYNIYRGTVSGGPYTRINSTLNTAPYYSDSTVQAGQTYYFVTTAVDSSGLESSYSNQAQAVVPSP